jgi:hypothetical protein
MDSLFLLARKLHLNKLGMTRAASNATRQEVKMKVAERVKTIPVPEDEAIIGESLRDWLTNIGYQGDATTEGERVLRAELSSWDEEGRVIAEQIIARFPRLFPYFSKH